MPVGIEAACGRRGAGAASGGAEWSRVTRSRGGRFARLGFVPGQGFDGTAPWIRKRRMWEGRGGGLRRQESPEPAGIDRQRRLRQGLVWVGEDTSWERKILTLISSSLLRTRMEMDRRALLGLGKH
jgi:hypothetical protein